MLLALSFLLVGFLIAGETQPQSRYPAVAAKAGEICVVCGMPVSSGDIAIILKGRRVPVMRDMAAVVLRNPEIYFNDKQARARCSRRIFNLLRERHRLASAWVGSWPGSTFCRL